MVKPTSNKSILFLFLILSILILSSCGKSECKSSLDCPSQLCKIPKCEDRKCAYSVQPNCCGNRINESLESGKPGDKCTCPQDYGKCEGKAKVRIGTRTQDAVYAGYYCNYDNRCVLGADQKDVLPQNVLDTINTGFFKASSVLKYNKPFDMGRDVFEVKITLDDSHKDLVLPVKITGIKMLFNGDYSRSELLIAEKSLDNPLSSIGDSTAISVPLNLGYRPQEAEEAGSLRYTIDYSYTKKVSSGRTPAGDIIYKEEISREKFNSPAKQIFFVRAE
ncbi:hypothetical protein HYX06_04000 [Candidatus Woesearchaeota archaeon]|nr:hypothetical protein [Candidatus Woesearchaeota archaeon]